MYSALFFVLFTGCYLWYGTSKKAKLGKVPPTVLRLAEQPQRAKILASVLFALVWIPLVLDQGFGSGTFALGAYIMSSFCLIILLNPLQYLRWQQLLGIFIAAMLLEFLVF